MRNAARCILPVVALVLFNSGSAWAQQPKKAREHKDVVVFVTHQNGDKNMRNAARCILPVVALVLFNSGSAWAQQPKKAREQGRCRLRY